MLGDDRTLLEYRAPRAMIGESHINELAAEIKHVQEGLLPTGSRDSDSRAALEATAESSLAFSDSRSREFVRALDGEPPAASLEVVRGRQALRDKQTAVDTEHFQHAATMEPDSVPAQLWLARVKHMTPGDTEGVNLLDRVLQRDPQNLEALATRAEFAREARDWRGAGAAFAERLRLMNTPPASDYCRLGDLEARSGDLVLAVGAFRTGIEKDPDSYLCHLEPGEIARANRRLDEARQHLEFVERHYPDAAPGIYLSLAAVYRAQGNLSRVREILQKGRRVFPNDQAIARITLRD